MIRTAIAILLLCAAPTFAQLKFAITTQPMGQSNKRSVAQYPLMISADLRHAVLFVHDQGKINVLRDGKGVGSYDWILPRSAVYTANSTLHFIAQRGEEMFVVTDNQPGKSYYDIQLPLIHLSGKLAFVAKPKGGKYFVVLDGAEGKPFDKIEHLQLNNDGDRVAYLGTRDGKTYVVDGDREIHLGDKFAANLPPTFSPDGKHLAYTYQLDRQRFVVIDDKTFGPYEQAGAPLFTRDSQHWAMIVRVAGKTQLIRDGQVTAEADHLGGLAWSPDGLRLAHVARNQDLYSLHVQDQKTPLPPGQSIAFVGFSPDSRRVAYAIRHDKNDYSLVMDDQNLGRFYRVWPPVFSSDSKRFATTVKTTASAGAILLDGKAMDLPLIGVNPQSLTFSPDGKRLAYIADPDGRGLHLYVDRQQVLPMPLVLQTPFDRAPLRWTAPDKLHTLVGDESFALTLADVTLQPE